MTQFFPYSVYMSEQLTLPDQGDTKLNIDDELHFFVGRSGRPH